MADASDPNVIITAPKPPPDIIVGIRSIDPAVIDRFLRIAEDTTDPKATIAAGNGVRHLLGIPDRVG